MEAKLARRSGGRSRKSVRQTKKTIDQLDCLSRTIQIILLNL